MLVEVGHTLPIFDDLALCEVHSLDGTIYIDHLENSGPMLGSIDIVIVIWPQFEEQIAEDIVDTAIQIAEEIVVCRRIAADPTSALHDTTSKYRSFVDESALADKKSGMWNRSQTSFQYQIPVGA